MKGGYIEILIGLKTKAIESKKPNYFTYFKKIKKIVKERIMMRYVLILIFICCFGTISNAQSETSLPAQTETELKERLEEAEQNANEAEDKRKKARKAEKKAERRQRKLERLLDDIEDRKESIANGEEEIKELEKELVEGKSNGELSPKDIMDLNEDILDEKKDLLKNKQKLEKLRRKQ